MEDHQRTASDQAEPTAQSGQVSAVEVLHLSHAELPVISIDGEPWVPFSRAMDQLDLNAEAQLRRLRRQPWAVVSRANVPVPGDQPRSTIVVDEATFLGHLFTVQVGNVRPDRREVLTAYQRETAQAIRGYWTRGVAVNPRGRTPLELALLENAPAMVEAFGHLQSGHYYDQFTDPPRSARIGRRDLPDGMTQTQARARALAGYRAGYAALAGPLLAVGHALADDEPAGDPATS